MKKDKDNITSTYIVDDSIVYNKIDEILASINPSVLDIIDKEDHLIPNERELVNNSDYDDYSFEEEELEDDDYYNEDLD